MNPFSGALVSRVADCGEEEVEAAIHEVRQYRVIMLMFILLSKAATAFKTWRKTTSKERAAVLSRIGDMLLAKKEELGAILTREQGKPRGEAEGEVGATAPWLVLRLSHPLQVGFAAAFFNFFAEECRRPAGEVYASQAPGKQFLSVREPLGVAAMVCPWNFPIGMPARKVSTEGK